MDIFEQVCLRLIKKIKVAVSYRDLMKYHLKTFRFLSKSLL
jgi:hypothetical protein